MVSNKFILVFLGIIFLVIVVLSSNRLAQSLRSRLGGLFPASKISSGSLTPTPTPLSMKSLVTPTTSAGQTKGDQTVRNQTQTPQTDRIPSTGPQEIAYLAIVGSGLIGVLTRSLTRRKN